MCAYGFAQLADYINLYSALCSLDDCLLLIIPIIELIPALGALIVGAAVGMLIGHGQGHLAEMMVLNLADDMANDAPPIVETFTPL